MLGKRPVTAEAVTPISLEFGAELGPVNAYVKVGSSPVPWTQMLTVVDPEEGRVTVSGEPCTPQVFPPVRKPIKSTSIGDDAAAVVGSTMTMLFPAAAGCPEVSAMVPAETSNGATTNGARFDSGDGLPGFCTCTVRVPADATSEGFNTVVQVDVEAQVVLRAMPLIKIVEAELPLPATKLAPWTDSGKLSTAPAMTLDGRITSIVGPLVMAIVAEADFDGSAALVATTEIAFGDGAAAGAE